MRTTRLAMALILAPAALSAQDAAGRPQEPRATAQARVEQNLEARIPAHLSAETRARLEAQLQAALHKELPTKPMTDRMAEGAAKGASEAAIVAASGRVLAELEASQEAMIRAGRERPSGEEIERGARVIARGATAAQLEAIVRRTPSDRSLVVAFEVLTDLAARGLPVDRALAVVGARLEAGATDGQLIALGASATGQAQGSAAAGLGKPEASAAGTVRTGLGVTIGRRP